MLELNWYQRYVKITRKKKQHSVDILVLSFYNVHVICKKYEQFV